ncbi:hypothetical protein [Streptomyces sp. STCH 565 A]|uniref:hypothetical protein n=1 Tax=Streptomyces sp. STCH 565 A TaxID=2950532 RepID=UPI002075F651|nr:hypothetical protein [Streptomyces sp. STCH 565 A]MCM8548935.1 hypothetical protein [Streptomyces sp. STCH 565 A]
MVQVPVPPAKISAELTDPGPGEHLWAILTMHRVSDDTIRRLNRGEDPGPGILDHEGLLTLEGPGCFKCEQPYSRYVAHRKCTGTLDLQPDDAGSRP